MSTSTRRQFLVAGLAGAGALSVGLLAYSRYGGQRPGSNIPQLMGNLRLVDDETTGLPILKLPDGFRYKTLSWVGTAMSDGFEVPGAADGMGVVRQAGNRVTLVRNHELQGSSGAFGPPESVYDQATPGGTTTLVFDTRSEEIVESWTSLNGTLYNCAGGVTPWGSWLSCEESTFNPAMAHLAPPRKQTFWSAENATRPHGYVFEVPAEGVAEPVPLLDMGQFYHEAVVIDPATGIAYMTEDTGPNAGFYRFLPNVPGRLAEGGKLQMMKVVDRPDMTDYLRIGEPMDVEWVDIPDPTAGLVPEYPHGNGVVSQGLEAGGSAFVALEGCAIADGHIWFTSKLGGRAMSGCVYEYHPATEKIWLVFESPGHHHFSGPDNLVVSPRGALVVCEDRLASQKAGQVVAGLTQKGEFFRFCQVNPELKGEYGGHDLSKTARGSEWAGATFSDDGEWMFLNIYNPGFTVAITGPWQEGYI